MTCERHGMRIKTVLVTGGTVRLGAAIAERLRAEGWRVLTSSHRADAGADIVADLAEPMGAVKLYSAAMNLLGGNPPEALVNNAALFTGDDAAIAAVNLESPKKLTTLMAGRETGVGAVVNVLDAGLSLGERASCPFSGSPRMVGLSRLEARAFSVYARERRHVRGDLARQWRRTGSGARADRRAREGGRDAFGQAPDGG